MYEDLDNDPDTQKLRLSATKSRLYLDCLTRNTEGEYTCVAETLYMRKTQSTIVKVGESTLGVEVVIQIHTKG